MRGMYIKYFSTFLIWDQPAVHHFLHIFFQMEYCVNDYEVLHGIKLL